MLLPYWTNNCIGSMEGLLFESSATTPYHFLNQSELSDCRRRTRWSGCPYGPSGSPERDARAAAPPAARACGTSSRFSPDDRARDARAAASSTQIATTGPWTLRRARRSRTWHLFLRARRAASSPALPALPNVVSVLGVRGRVAARERRVVAAPASVAASTSPQSGPSVVAAQRHACTSHDGDLGHRRLPVRRSQPTDRVATSGCRSVSFHVSSRSASRSWCA